MHIFAKLYYTGYIPCSALRRLKHILYNYLSAQLAQSFILAFNCMYDIFSRNNSLYSILPLCAMLYLNLIICLKTNMRQKWARKVLVNHLFTQTSRQNLVSSRFDEEQTAHWPKEKSTKGQTTIYKANAYNTKDRVTWTPLKAGCEFRCFGRVCFSSF
jgi:hypothetical protein